MTHENTGIKEQRKYDSAQREIADSNSTGFTQEQMVEMIHLAKSRGWIVDAKRGVQGNQWRRK